MTRVVVVGAGGRMGQTVCEAILDDDDLELVAAVDPSVSGADVGELLGRDQIGVSVEASIAHVTVDVDVAVDFTVVDAARSNLEWCAASSIHAVVGTTGFTDTDLDRFREVFTSSNILIAANFAIGAVLMMRFWRAGGTVFRVRLRSSNCTTRTSSTHPRVRPCERLNGWRPRPRTGWPTPQRDEVLSGSRGGSGPGGIPIHSIRLRGLVAHQEVLFGTTGQSLTIRHDSYDRTSFMPGVLQACKVIDQHGGLTVGLDAYLGI